MRRSVAFLILAVLLLGSACKGEPAPVAEEQVEPTPSGEGQWISFVSERDGSGEIYKMTAAGSHVTNLTNNPADDWLPSWSPDGNWIAFTSERDENGEIYKMTADGGQVTRLTNNPTDDWAPSWGP